MAKLSWNDLFMNGSVVDLDVSIWGARTKLRAADLGIEDSDAVSKALNLGTHRLAPIEAFEPIHEAKGKAKRAVEHFSLPFGFIKGARYVPAAKLPELRERLAAVRAEFDAAVDAFIDGYAAMKEKQLPLLEQALKDAAKTPEAAEAAIARLREEYPEPDKLRALFGIKWAVYAVQGSKSAAAESAVKEEAENVRDVVKGMVSGLREEVATKLADVLGLIQRGGSLKARSLESAVAVLDRIDAVNILGDSTLTEQVAALRRALLAIEPGKRINDATVSGLEEVRAALQGSVDEAVAAAEQSLTAVGRRKLATPARAAASNGAKEAV